MFLNVVPYPSWFSTIILDPEYWEGKFWESSEGKNKSRFRFQGGSGMRRGEERGWSNGRYDGKRQGWGRVLTGERLGTCEVFVRIESQTRGRQGDGLRKKERYRVRTREWRESVESPVTEALRRILVGDCQRQEGWGPGRDVGERCRDGS